MRPAVRMISATVVVDDPDYEDSLGIPDELGLIEYAGRWDYGAKNAAKLGTNPNWLSGRLDTSEESMVEVVDVGFLITCSRVVSHELVRHRLATFQQESQRFTNYGREEFLDIFHVPGPMTTEQGDVLAQALSTAKTAYNTLLGLGFPKQLARYVLPNAMRTHIVMKANLREWRHILHQRMHTSAQPEMQEIARLIHGKLQRRYGAVLFPDNIADERAPR